MVQMHQDQVCILDPCVNWIEIGHWPCSAHSGGLDMDGIWGWGWIEQTKHLHWMVLV